jgi:hypothetical protein
MTRNRRRLLALACASAFPFVVVACKKEPPPAPVIDAAPALVETAPAPVELAPLVEDAGPDVADADAAAKKPTGPGMNLNQSRAKQCCQALRAQAKALGASPEAAQLQAFAATCDGLAAQLGPSTGPKAPELAPLRAMLQGKTLPGICQGL